MYRIAIPHLTAFLVVSVICSSCLPFCANAQADQADESEWVLKSRQEWQKIARKEFKTGIKEEVVDKGMVGRFLAKMKWPYVGGNRYRVIYRVDDITELVFDYNLEGVLDTPPFVMKPRIWVRNPYSKTGDADFLKSPGGEHGARLEEPSKPKEEK